MSNSTCFGRTYLEHALADISDFLQGRASHVLFIPYAFVPAAGDEQQAWDRYASRPREALAKIGITVDAIHHFSSPESAVRDAEAIFIGGGNTFHLLTRLYKFGLVDLIRRRIEQGLPVTGASAGTNVQCPTIRTTNDMPIIQPPSFDAIGAVPFQINPHYLDPDRRSTHQGETREERISEFLRLNDVPVLGLREGAWLVVNGYEMTLKGSTGARLFRQNHDAVEYGGGADLSFLLTER